MYKWVHGIVNFPFLINDYTFEIIHYYARFFIVLFRMMLCVGLSELSSYKDVEFIRSSLMYDKIEPDDVKESFQQIFEHVVKGCYFKDFFASVSIYGLAYRWLVRKGGLVFPFGSSCEYH